ncbi:MAG: M56 family metallopeptidase [Lachnospiraceae bacterium]|nr:M56 family metallopeptidase [Lachnospiraceae bacterium]
MSEWIKILLSLSLSGTLLFLLILAFKQGYKNRFSKCWQYYILFAVVLRFLVPLTSDTTLVGLLFGAAENTMERVVQREAEDFVYDADYIEGVGNHDIIKKDNAIAEDTSSEQNSDFADLGNNTIQLTNDIGIYLFFAWLAVALTMLVRKITIYQSFLRYINAGKQEVSDIEVLNRLSDCEELLQINKTVELYQNPLVGSPMLVGFFHPCIILPDQAAGAEGLSYIFTHELIHMKRWDIVYKWLVQIVVCVHWFNPFVYLLEKEVDRACELSCDEAVLASWGDSAKKAYGDTLLLFLKRKDEYKNPFASVTLTEGAEQIKERLGAIMNFKKMSKMITAMAVVLTVIICACFQTLGVYAKQEKTPNQAQTKVEESKDPDWQASDDEPLYDSLLYDEDNNVYYILCHGASFLDMPNSVFSDGTIGIVLVKKDEYCSVGPFSRTGNLVNKVNRQLQYALKNGYGTQEDADIILKVAEEIQDSMLTPSKEVKRLEEALSEEKAEKKEGYSYVYTQSGYYQNPFVIEMGWNLNARAYYPTYRQAQVPLTDHTKMTIWLADDAKEFAGNQEALSAIGALIQSLKDQNPYPSIEMPLILRIDFVAENDLEDYAKECFETNDLIGFSAVFPELDSALQSYYCEHVYDNDKIAFFSNMLPKMEQKLLTQYADQAYKDGRVNFFAVILDYMEDYMDMDYSNDFIDGYAQKAYEQNDIAAFAIIASHMTEEATEKWLIKARNDKKVTVYSVLID